MSQPRHWMSPSRRKFCNSLPFSGKGDGDGGDLYIHQMGVVADIADRVLVMYRGEAVETGSVEEIFCSPQHPYTQSLLAAVPRLEMRGQDLPRRFPLPGQPLAESETPDTVVAGEPILQVRDLVARFPVRGGLLNRVMREVHAVEKVSFDLWPGETLSLVGESGCGKSTTGRALLRLVDTEGRHHYLRRSADRYPRRRQAAGSAAQYSVYFSGSLRLA